MPAADLKSCLNALRDSSHLFSLLDDQELANVESFLEHRELPAGACLFKEGERGEYLGIIRSGRLEVKKKTEFEGNQILLAVLSRGSFIGELSIVDEQPRAASASAIEDSQVSILTRDAFDRFVAQYPQAGVKIYRALSRVLSIRLRTMVDRLSDVF